MPRPRIALPRPKSLPVSRTWLVAVLALAAVIAAALYPGVGEAQGPGGENDYVDLELILESPHEQATPVRRLKITLLNNGARTAYDVEVVVNVVYPEDSSYMPQAPKAPVGAASLEDNGTTLRWTIPEFGGLQRAEVNTQVSHDSLVDPVFDHAGKTHEFYGKVTTSSFESDLHQRNNADRVWSSTSALNVFNASQAKGEYSVKVSVNEPSPSPGGTVNFKITAIHYRDIPLSVIDQKVAIELTDGLAVDTEGTISYDPPTRADSVLYSNGVFNIGTLEWSDKLAQHAVTLPIKVSSDAIVNEQCLTATITGNPPPGPNPGDDDISDNVAKVCLGEPPAESVIFTREQTDLFTWYDCVSKSSYPCSDQNSLELVVLGMSASVASGAPYEIFEPGNVIVHVPDPGGRNTSSDSNSSALVWSTGIRDDPTVSGDDRFVRRGVYIGDNQTLLAPGKWGVEPSGESGERTGNLVVNVSGPGAASVWGIYDAGMGGYEAYEFLSEATNGEMYNGTWYLQYRSDIYAEFSALGTYKLIFSATASLNAGTPGDTTDDTAHTDTETYTFHIGPMTDLELREGGAYSHAPGDRSVLTIIAANNGPDHSLGARVTGLPTGAEVIHISQGSYDGSTGVWNIGELKRKVYLRSEGKPEEATLILGAAAGETATASIANSKNYEVCIGSDASTLNHGNRADCEAVTGASWHTGTVYDPPANNTATITATRGAAGVGPGSPGIQGATANSRSVTIAWEEVEYLHSITVSHYEVQKYLAGAERWETVAREVYRTEYTDFNVGSGQTAPYRVRSVSEAGVAGPWSREFNRLVAQRQGQLAAPRLTAITTTDDAAKVTWTAPTNQQGAITGYELELLSGQEWTLLQRLAADEKCGDGTPRCYEDLGLPSGSERRYRIRAMAGADPGRWSNEATAYTPPGYPSGIEAEANGHNAIFVLWSPPADATNGRTVTRYELQVSTDDGDTWSSLASPGRTSRVYNHTGLQPEESRSYRIRACNKAGCSFWNGPAFARTAARGVPAAPSLTLGASNPSEISLSWNQPGDGGSEITGYVLEHYTDGSDWTKLDLYPAIATEFIHQDTFGGGTVHLYRVRAVNDEGNGAWSRAVRVTISAQAPGKPELSFEELTDHSSDSSLILTWTAPETNGSRITGYRVERNDRGGWGEDNWVRVGSTGASVTSYTDRNLYSGEYYCYRVAASSSAGPGAYSDEKCEFTTGPGPSAPEPPIVRLGSVSPDRVTITWDPPSDDGGRPVTGYVYEKLTPSAQAFEGNCEYHSGDRDLWTEACNLASPGTRTVTFSDLEPGKSYKFRVRTETTYINGDWAELAVHLPASADDPDTTGVTEDLQVRVSTTSLTVNEGRGVARYTVRLNKSPKAAVEATETEPAVEAETVRLDWSLDDYGDYDILVEYGDVAPFVFDNTNWNTGFTFTLSAAQDTDSDNDIVIMRHIITIDGKKVSGPGVRLEVRDND